MERREEGRVGPQRWFLGPEWSRSFVAHLWPLREGLFHRSPAAGFFAPWPPIDKTEFFPERCDRGLETRLTGAGAWAMVKG